MSWFGQDDDENGFSTVNVGQANNSPLYTALMQREVLPGEQPDYELCKLIFTLHTLGGKIVEAPVELAQSQERELQFAYGPAERLKEAFLTAREELSADTHIKHTRVLSKVYGISAVVCGERGKDPKTPIDFTQVADADLYFSTFDPLNMAGSLTLNQDPNSPDFLKPTAIRVSGQEYHPSRVVVMMNGQPVYIQWSNSAFGYTGRSDYQRCLYPLATFMQTEITNNFVTKKAGLLTWFGKQAASIVNALNKAGAAIKRVIIKSGVTGNVLQLGPDDRLETLNMMNLEGPAKFARDNVLKDIATGVGMPAIILNQETYASGLAEGGEDAKTVARYIEGERRLLKPLYDLFDKVAMYRAWSPAWYETLQATDKDFRKIPYETAFRMFVQGFKAVWPNLLQEPQSDVLKGEKDRFECLVDVVAAAAPLAADPKNRAILLGWIGEEVSARKELFSTPLEFDLIAAEEYEPPMADVPGGDDTKEPKNRAFRGDSVRLRLAAGD